MRLREFDESDYEIHNRPKLDKILAELCYHVIKGQRIDSEKYGMVAACVLDPENRKVYGVNEAAGDGKRRHAERVAIDRYIKHYGEVPQGSIIITTLSPCNEYGTEMADERYGESCTDLINDSNIRKVYCGYMDPSQTDDQAQYTLEASSNLDIKRLCEKFASTFLDLDEAWSQKYKQSINCSNPRGFSQRAHCQGRKKHNEELAEKVNRTGSNELVIFDIDDTLLHTTAKINVIKDGQVVRSLTNQEFNNYKLGPGEEFDFGEFRNAQKFEEESVPIGPMLDKLRADLASGKNVVMLTARADFDNQKAVWRTFKRHGIDINKDVHLFRAGNLPGDGSPAVKKAIHVSKWLRSGQYNKVVMYDDSEKNLTVFKSLEKKFPAVEFEAHHVSEEGDTRQIENFHDGRNPQDKGDSKRHNVPTKGKISTLRKIAKQGGRRGQLAHWMANMRSGRAKKNK